MINDAPHHIALVIALGLKNLYIVGIGIMGCFDIIKHGVVTCY
jgi:hypothetical protein